MKPDHAKSRFGEYLLAGNRAIGTVLPAEGIDAMVRFYEEQRARGCDLDHDGDMLLFQWGTYDWGEGARFELNITRQFILDPRAEDDAISQLSLSFSYLPTEATRSLGAGDRWCQTPDHLEEFRQFVHAHPAFEAASRQPASSVSLRYEQV